MIKPITISECVARFGGELIGPDVEFFTACIDARASNPESIFVALPGQYADGHQFLSQLKEYQGRCALISDRTAIQEGLSYWLVDNTQDGLVHIAQLRRAQFSGCVLGLTGSSGKTTVKAMVKAILSQAFGDTCVFATHGNLNNHLGVPLSLLSIQPDCQYAIIEMGASAVGEIAQLAALAKPHIALVNNVMPAHVEGFGSLERIAIGKGEIYQALSSHATAIINSDDDFSHTFNQLVGSRPSLRYSTKSEIHADVYATDIHCHADSSTFTLHYQNDQLKVKLPIEGLHNVKNFLAASACALAAGATLTSIKAGANHMSFESGRLTRVAGLNGSTIVDDSYNANPGSMKAAIDVLANSSSSTLLILGDMAELGDQSAQLHQQVGEYAREKNIHALFAYGHYANDYLQGFGDNGQSFDDLHQMIHKIKECLTQTSSVLIKGSRGAQMERVVSALTTKEDTATC